MLGGAGGVEAERDETSVLCGAGGRVQLYNSTGSNNIPYNRPTCLLSEAQEAEEAAQGLRRRQNAEALKGTRPSGVAVAGG